MTWIPVPDTDPVCGATVNIRMSALLIEYLGKVYYFCSPKCKEEFTSDPNGYTKRI
jgi:YHS domain-containing protein